MEAIESMGSFGWFCTILMGLVLTAGLVTCYFQRRERRRDSLNTIEISGKGLHINRGRWKPSGDRR